MIKMITFLSLEKQLLALQQSYQQAKEEREYEKEHQNLFQKAADVVFDTDREENLERIGLELRDLKGRVKDKLALYCQGCDNSFVENDENLKIIHERYKKIKGISDDVLGKLQSGEQAQRSLGLAKFETGTASSLELCDIVTHSTGISLVSYLQTGHAEDALSRAEQAVSLFRSRIQKQTTIDEEVFNDLHLDVELGGQTFNDMGMGFLSWMNMSSLDASGARCQQSWDSIDQMLSSIERVHKKLQKEKYRAFDALEGALLPFRTEVAKGFSPALYELLPINYKNLEPQVEQDNTPEVAPSPKLSK